MTATTSRFKPPLKRAGKAGATGEILTILSGLMLGMFLATLDQTIDVHAAIKTIGNGDLHGLSAQAWVTAPRS